ARHLARGFVLAQTEKDGLPQGAVAGPFVKFNLADQHGLEPVATLHLGRSDGLAPAGGAFLGKVHERALVLEQRLKGAMQTAQGGLVEARAHLRGEPQLAVLVIANDERAEMLPAATRLAVAADDHLLLVD